MTLLSILAVTATPAISSLLGTRERALGAEAARLLSSARARASATGEPTGVRFDEDGAGAALVRIAEAGGAPEALEASGVRWSAFGSARIGEVENGDGSSWRTIWFGAHGRPEVRDEDGALEGGFTQDATVRCGAQVITVTRLTGRISR